MLDRREIRQNPDAVKAAVRAKGIDLDVDEILHLDAASRKLQHELDQAQARRRSSSREFAQADEARRAELRAEHAELETHLRTLREQLAETTVRPGARTLLKVTVEDAARANELMQVLMGEEVEPRRQYIEAHAVEVTNLDI